MSSLEPWYFIVCECKDATHPSKSSGCENPPRRGMGRMFAAHASCVSFIRLLYPQAICIALATWAESEGDNCEIDADGMCGNRVGDRRLEATF
jgi:hypothetical protein